MSRARFVTLWALVGVTLVLADGCARLGLRALRLLEANALSPLQWVCFAAIVGAFAWGEGYLALQRRFMPAVLARAHALGAAPRGFCTFAAPLHALGLIGVPRATLLRAWAGAFAIVGAAVAVRALPEPWRAMVDGGVSVALAWGIVALWLQHHAVGSSDPRTTGEGLSPVTHQS